MPRINLINPVGTTFPIDSRSDLTLRSWFDEVLPVITQGWDISNPAMAPRIQVWPSALAGSGEPADWIADSRVITSLYPFPYRDGTSAMEGLAELRALLILEIERLNAARGQTETP